MGLDAPEVFEIIKVTRTNNNVILASLVVLVYDHFLSFNDEFSLVWGTNWNTSKTLYFLTRYITYVDTILTIIYKFSLGSSISYRACFLLYQVSGWFIALGGTIAEVVLVYRTLIIWNRRRNVGCFLVILLLGAIVAGAIMTYYGLRDVTVVSNPGATLKNQPSCIAYSYNATVLWDYAIVAIVETVILILTLVKAYEHYKFASGSSLVRTLYRDGLVFYVYLLVLTIANVVTIQFFLNSVSLIMLQRVFNGILPAHILLHIRKAAVKDKVLPGHPDSEQTMAYSTVSFPLSSEGGSSV